MPSRRQFLAIAASVGFAGCSALPSQSTPETTTPVTTAPADTRFSSVEPDSFLPEPDLPADQRVALDGITVRDSAFLEGWMGPSGAAGGAGRRFVFCAVNLGGGSSVPSFELRVDDDRYESTSLADYHFYAMGVRVDGLRRPSTHRDAPPGWLAFEVPAPLDTEDAAIVANSLDREWGLFADALDALDAPKASFALRQFSVPEDGGTVRLVVENDGDVDGTCRVAVDTPTVDLADDDSATLLGADLSPGERAAWETTYRPSGGNQERATVGLRGSVRAEQSVVVE